MEGGGCVIIKIDEAGHGFSPGHLLFLLDDSIVYHTTLYQSTIAVGTINDFFIVMKGNSYPVSAGACS
jgi:hypothetical protein